MIDKNDFKRVEILLTIKVPFMISKHLNDDQIKNILRTEMCGIDFMKVVDTEIDRSNEKERCFGCSNMTIELLPSVLN